MEDTEYSNTRFSVCLSNFAGSTVVSVFKVENGEPDFSREEFYRAFRDPQVAAQAFEALKQEAMVHRFGGGRVLDKLLPVNAFRFVTRHLP